MVFLLVICGLLFQADPGSKSLEGKWTVDRVVYQFGSDSLSVTLPKNYLLTFTLLSDESGWYGEDEKNRFSWRMTTNNQLVIRHSDGTENIYPLKVEDSPSGWFYEAANLNLDERKLLAEERQWLDFFYTSAIAANKNIPTTGSVQILMHVTR